MLFNLLLAIWMILPIILMPIVLILAHKLRRTEQELRRQRGIPQRQQPSAARTHAHVPEKNAPAWRRPYTVPTKGAQPQSVSPPAQSEWKAPEKQGYEASDHGGYGASTATVKIPLEETPQPAPPSAAGIENTFTPQGIDNVRREKSDKVAFEQDMSAAQPFAAGKQAPAPSDNAGTQRFAPSDSTGAHVPVPPETVGQQAFDSSEGRWQAPVASTLLPPAPPYVDAAGSHVSHRPRESLSPEAVHERKRVRALNLMLALGTLLVLIAGLIFATSSWRWLPNFMRLLVVSSVIVLFFCMAYLARARFSLWQTSTAFYLLGCLFLPVACLAIGYFRLFGNWFSLAGAGRPLLGLLAAVLTGAACAIGARVYRVWPLIWGALVSVPCGILCILVQTHATGGLWMLLCALCCTALFAIVGWLRRRTETQGIWTKRLTPFLLMNLLAFSVWAFGALVPGVMCGLAFLLFACLCLSRQLDREQNDLAALRTGFFAVFLMLAACLVQDAKTLETPVLWMTLVSVIVWLLYRLSVFKERHTARYLPMACWALCVMTLVLGVCASVEVLWRERTTSWSLVLLLSAAVLTAIVTIEALTRRRRSFLYAQPFFAMLLCNGILSFLPLPSSWKLFANVFVCAAFCILYHRMRYPKTGVRLRTVVSDAVYSITCLVYCLALVLETGGGWLSALACVPLCLLLTWLAAGRPEGTAARVYAFVQPLALFLPLLSLGNFLPAALLAQCWCVGFAFYVFVMLESPCKAYRYFDTPNQLAMLLCGMTLLFTGQASFLHFLLWLVYSALWLRLLYRRERKSWFGAKSALVLTGLSGLCVTVKGIANLLYTTFGLPASTWSGPFWILCGLVCVSALYAFGYFLLQRRRPNDILLQPLFWLMALSLPMSAFVLSLYYGIGGAGQSMWYVLPCLLSLVGAYAALYHAGRGPAIQGALPFAAYGVFLQLGLAVGHNASWGGCLTMLVFWILLVTMSRAFYTRLYAKQERKIDWPACWSFVSPLFMLVMGNSYWRFGAWLLLCVTIFLLRRRVQGRYADAWIWTAAGCTLCIAWWTQPFFIMTEVLRTEWMLLPLVLFTIALRRNIWRAVPGAVYWLQFAVGVFCTLWLASDAIRFERLTDVLILASAELVLLLLAFARRHKSWFLLAGVTLTLLVLYLSRLFWLSLAWWMYLLLAGLLLIFVASCAEYNRRRGVPREGRFLHQLRDWKW